MKQQSIDLPDHANRCAGRISRENACPYGKPGDRLWVREAWADLTESHGRQYERCNAATGLYERGTEPFVWYRADGEQPDNGNGAEKYAPWRPCISMPRWAGRITLEIVRVRVERLQDISPDDCIAEGAWSIASRELGRGEEAFAAYRKLWESINGPGSWDKNDWVWVIELKLVTP
jgi:hypothetical protein